MNYLYLLLFIVVLIGCNSTSSTNETKVDVWPNGKIKTESKINNNQVKSQKGWDEHGILKYEFTNIFEDTIMTFDSLEGYYIEYINVSRYEKRFYKNGNVKLEGEIVNSKPNGDWLYFNEMGDTIKKEVYLNGKIIIDGRDIE